VPRIAALPPVHLLPGQLRQALPKGGIKIEGQPLEYRLNLCLSKSRGLYLKKLSRVLVNQSPDLFPHLPSPLPTVSGMT
jgi:hypothetical protein